MMENFATLSGRQRRNLFFIKFIQGSTWNATLATNMIKNFKQWEINWALQVAIYYRKIDIISFLILQGVKITIIDGCSRKTAIHVAEETRFYEAVDLLLDFHELWYEPNPTDLQGKSHFHIACKINHLRAINRMLLENATCVNTGFQVNDDTEPNTPLHIAVFHRFWELVLLLLNNGADPNIQNFYGTPMHWIFRFGILEVYECHEADARTPIIKFLCEAGFKYDSVDRLQNTILTLAFILLKNLACERHVVSSNTKRMVLSRIKSRLDYLLEYGERSKSLSINYNTWHWISTWNKSSSSDENLFSYYHDTQFVTEIVELFINHNLSLNGDKNLNSDPPVLIAAKVYNYELLSVLLKKGADVSQFSFEWLDNIELRTADTMLNVTCMYYLLKQHGWKPVDAYREELTILRYLLKSHNLSKYKAAGDTADLFVEENVFYTLEGLGLLSDFDLIDIVTQQTSIILLAQNLKQEDDNLKKLMIPVKDEELTNLTPLQRAIERELRRAKQVKLLKQISVYDFCMSDDDECFYLSPAELWRRVTARELSEEFPIFKKIIKTFVVKKLVRGFSKIIIKFFQQRLVEIGLESRVESCAPVKNMTNADILFFCENNFDRLNVLENNSEITNFF